MVNLEKRIIAFAKLGKVLREFDPDQNRFPLLNQAVKKAFQENKWFSEENILFAFHSLGGMLEESKIRQWVGIYELRIKSESTNKQPKKIGVIMAGNIPLAGFHDFLCVLMSGNIFIGKLSSDDKFLLPAVAQLLAEIEPGFSSHTVFTDAQIRPASEAKKERGKAKEVLADAFIATGSNNTARYFEYYFGKYPHIIRKNRNSIAILDGNETEEELKNLGKDIFQYFGLGCRNVSKIFIPEDYNLDKLFAAIVDFGDVIHHNKYFNNYNYYRSIYLLNKEKFLDNNFLLVKEEKQMASPVATLYYERYKSKEEVFEKLKKVRENIQCVVSSAPAPSPFEKINIRPGQSQSPELWDYADNVDTMEFLLKL